MSAFSSFHSLAALGIKEFLKYSDLEETVLTHSLHMHASSTPRKHKKTLRFSDVFSG